jgi:hypothetical protein
MLNIEDTCQFAIKIQSFEDVILSRFPHFQDAGSGYCIPDCYCLFGRNKK